MVVKKGTSPLTLSVSSVSVNVSIKPFSLPRPKPMTHQLSSPDFHGEEKSEQVTSIGQIKPELYRLRGGDQGEGKAGDNCGKISFLLRYAFK